MSQLARKSSVEAIWVKLEIHQAVAIIDLYIQKPQHCESKDTESGTIPPAPLSGLSTNQD